MTGGSEAPRPGQGAPAGIGTDVVRRLVDFAGERLK
jgi:hypothetical protein